MPGKYLHLTLVLAMSTLVAGCGLGKKGQPGTQTAQTQINVPPEFKGTVAEQAFMQGGEPLAVGGYSLVVGLGKNGSSECDPRIEAYLVDYLKKVHKLGWSIHNTKNIDPRKIIRDFDTSVVFVRGVIPPGAPKGTRIDLEVRPLPGSQTVRLDGGLLMPTELYRLINGVPSASTGSPVMAMGAGPLLVNPFVEATSPENLRQLCNGRIVGGGLVSEHRPIRLQLHHPDHGRVSYLAKRINERFSAANKDVARGVNNYQIELEIPRSYRENYERFTQLVMHLPMVAGGDLDAMTLRVAELMDKPETTAHEDLALIWEAIGRQTVGTVQRFYASKDPRIAFLAARTGLRLGDKQGAELMITAALMRGDYQLKAIEELGWHGEVLKAGSALRQLLESECDDELVRLAAYESLLRRGDPCIQTTDVEKHFKLDVVPSKSRFAIYARQSGEPRIVLFGRDIPLTKPMFYCSNDLITLNANAGDSEITGYRTVASTGTVSSPFSIKFDVESLILTLGQKAEKDAGEKFRGMGLTYGQIVSVLSRMCKDGCIRAQFVLQPLPDIQKI